MNTKSNLSDDIFTVAVSNKPTLLIETFRHLIQTHGFKFREPVCQDLRARFAADPSSLNEEELRQLPYPFLDRDISLLSRLISGDIIFSMDEEDDLEQVCGDFFILDLTKSAEGIPRYENKALEAPKPVPTMAQKLYSCLPVRRAA